jgi:hypothetical protein
MTNMFIIRTATVAAFLGLSACTPTAPTMDVKQAQAYCQAKVSKPVDTRVHLGVGIGSGGKVSTNAGLSVGVDMNALISAEKAYEKCVMKNAGMAPSAPYLQPN